VDLESMDMITTKRKELDASMMMIKAKPDDAKLFTNSWNKSTVSICLSSGLWPRTTFVNSGRDTTPLPFGDDQLPHQIGQPGDVGTLIPGLDQGWDVPAGLLP
jgi:hypothetical protein